MARLTFHLFLFVLMATILTVSCAPIYTGRGTWFYPGLGACGEYNKNSDWIVALGKSTYAKGAHCNHNVKITYKGKTTTAQVRDLCEGCGASDLDMSPSLFEHFANLGVGVIHMSWSFV